MPGSGQVINTYTFIVLCMCTFIFLIIIKIAHLHITVFMLLPPYMDYTGQLDRNKYDSC